MKNTLLKTIGTAALTILMFAQISLSAQEINQEINEGKNDGQTQGKLFEPRGGARALEGTWDTQVTIRNCQNNAAIRTFASIGTFMSGGTSIGSTSGIPQALRTPEHGVWSYLGGREFKFSFKSFSFDAGGNFTGWTIVRHSVVVNLRATAYESFGTAEVYAPNGNLLFTGCSSTTAVRFE